MRERAKVREKTFELAFIQLARFRPGERGQRSGRLRRSLGDRRTELVRKSCDQRSARVTFVLEGVENGRDLGS